MLFIRNVHNILLTEFASAQQLEYENIGQESLQNSVNTGESKRKYTQG